MDGIDGARDWEWPRRSFSKSISRSMEDVFSGGRPFSLNSHVDEEALKWFAIGRLPTYDRLRSSIINSFMDNELHADKTMHKKVDVRKLDLDDRQEFINRIFKVAEDDNEKFLKKFRAFLLMILNAKRCFFLAFLTQKLVPSRVANAIIFCIDEQCRLKFETALFTNCKS